MIVIILLIDVFNELDGFDVPALLKVLCLLLIVFILFDGVLVCCTSGGDFNDFILVAKLSRNIGLFNAVAVVPRQDTELGRDGADIPEMLLLLIRLNKLLFRSRGLTIKLVFKGFTPDGFIISFFLLSVKFFIDFLV